MDLTPPMERQDKNGERNCERELMKSNQAGSGKSSETPSTHIQNSYKNHDFLFFFKFWFSKNTPTFFEI